MEKVFPERDFIDSLIAFRKTMLAADFGLQLSWGGLIALRTIDGLAHENGGLGVTMSMLADAMAITKPAATQLVNSLEKCGCVVRACKNGNRRSVYAELTPRGLRVLGRLRSYFKGICGRMSQRLDEAESLALVKAMNTFKDIIDSSTDERRKIFED